MYYDIADDDGEVVWPLPTATAIETPAMPRSLFEVIPGIQRLYEEDSRIRERLELCSDRFDEVVALLKDAGEAGTSVDKVMHLAENLRLIAGLYRTFIKDAQALESTKQKWLELADEGHMGVDKDQIIAQLEGLAVRSFRCTTEHPELKLQQRLVQICQTLIHFLNHEQRTWLFEGNRNLGKPGLIFSAIGSPVPDNESLPALQAIIADVTTAKIQKFLNTFDNDEGLTVETNEIFDNASAPRDSNHLDTRRYCLIQALEGKDISSDASDNSSGILSTIEETKEEIVQRGKMQEKHESGMLQYESSEETDESLAADPPPKTSPVRCYRDWGYVTIQPRRYRHLAPLHVRFQAERERAAAGQPSSPARETPVFPAVAVPAVAVPTWHRVFAFFGLVSVLPAVERVGDVFRRQPKRAREVEEGESDQGESEESGRQKQRRLE